MFHYWISWGLPTWRLGGNLSKFTLNPKIPRRYKISQGESHQWEESFGPQSKEEIPIYSEKRCQKKERVCEEKTWSFNWRESFQMQPMWKQLQVWKWAEDPCRKSSQESEPSNTGSPQAAAEEVSEPLGLPSPGHQQGGALPQQYWSHQGGSRGGEGGASLSPPTLTFISTVHSLHWMWGDHREYVVQSGWRTLVPRLPKSHHHRRRVIIVASKMRLVLLLYKLLGIYIYIHNGEMWWQLSVSVMVYIH